MSSGVLQDKDNEDDDYYDEVKLEGEVIDGRIHWGSHVLVHETPYNTSSKSVSEQVISRSMMTQCTKPDGFSFGITNNHAEAKPQVIFSRQQLEQATREPNT